MPKINSNRIQIEYETIGNSSSPAILSQGDRKPRLSELTIPALVIQGNEDPLVPLEGGKDTAEAIPGAEMVIIKGMGHEIPMMNRYWSRILEVMAAHMKKVQCHSILKLKN